MRSERALPPQQALPTDGREHVHLCDAGPTFTEDENDERVQLLHSLSLNVYQVSLGSTDGCLVSFIRSRQEEGEDAGRGGGGELLRGTYDDL